ncbi:MAG: hypothetical protein RIS54_170 [Verrucomicrobiota bacterium]|jgi:hypothetical protein
MFRIERLLFLTCCMAAAMPADAALTWKEQTLKLNAEAGADAITAVFAFTNTGDTTVTITDIKTDCGCTTAAPDKTSYAPGESGEIRTTFTIGNRVGRERKSMHVSTDDRPGEPVKLTLDVTIPPLLTLTPRMVAWARGAAAEPQTIDLRLHPRSGSSSVAVAADGEGITHRLEQLTPTTYRLHLTPSDTSHPAKVRFWVRVTRPGREPLSYIAFAQVR